MEKFVDRSFLYLGIMLILIAGAAAFSLRATLRESIVVVGGQNPGQYERIMLADEDTLASAIDPVPVRQKTP